MNTGRRNYVKRFRELGWVDVNCDLHMHTNQTDGQAAIDEILATAVEKGLTRVAFTEHVRKETEWFADFAVRVREAAERYPGLTVLVGCEAKALDAHGNLDASQEILQECDIVLGSVHRFPDGQGGFVPFDALDLAEMAQVEFELARGLLRAAPIDVLAHPGGMYSRRHGPFPEELMRQLMIESLVRGIAVEINSSYLPDLPAFLHLCTEVNPFVSVGSDMHALNHVGRCRDMLLAEGIPPP